MAELDKNTMLKILDSCYDKAIEGLPMSESVDDLAREYCSKYSNHRTAAEKMCKTQAKKCGTSGFITGLGGIITLPVAIPANLSSVIYIQLRMIATVAKIAGFDPSDDQVRTMAYVCLTGSAATDIVKKFGINVGQKMTTTAIKKIPGTVLVKVNQAVGFRLVTKFGTKGAVNLTKLVPLVGGVIGGGVDVVSTNTIAKIAIKMFIDGEI